MTRGEQLLWIARAALEEAFGGPEVRQPAGAPWLGARGAVFVTLTKGGDLRGCVGQLEPRSSLFNAVREAACSAAFRDRRFPPVRREELADLHIAISVLSPMEALAVNSEADALRQLRPGVDGVVLTCGPRSGVFIPDMWKQLPDKEEFLFHLKQKAGLPTDAWLAGTQVKRFTAEVWEEPERASAGAEPQRSGPASSRRAS